MTAQPGGHSTRSEIDIDSDDDTDRNEKGKRLAGNQLDSVRKIRKFSTVNSYLAGTL